MGVEHQPDGVLEDILKLLLYLGFVFVVIFLRIKYHGMNITIKNPPFGTRFLVHFFHPHRRVASPSYSR